MDPGEIDDVAELMSRKRELDSKQKEIFKKSNFLLEGSPSASKWVEEINTSPILTKTNDSAPKLSAPFLSVSGPPSPRPRESPSAQKASPPRPPSPTESNEDPLESPTPGMGTEATIRYQKGRIKVLTTALDNCKHRAESAEGELAKVNVQFDLQKKTVRKLERTVASLENQSKTQKEQLEGLKDRERIQQREIGSLQKRLGDAEKELKSAETAQGTKDVRLTRAQEEVERLRQQLKESKDVAHDAQQRGEAEVIRLKGAVRQLQKQQTELFSIFRKQMKLIDVLKRQKLHIEAAQLLQFTEEEFSKTLEVGK